MSLIFDCRNVMALAASTVDLSWETIDVVSQSDILELSPAIVPLTIALENLSEELSRDTDPLQHTSPRRSQSLRVALEASRTNLSTVQALAKDIDRLEVTDRKTFLDELALASSRQSALSQRIAVFVSILDSLLPGRTSSSLSASDQNVTRVPHAEETEKHPESVLERIQNELVAEGVDVRTLEHRHTEIKYYLKRLISEELLQLSRKDSHLPALPSKTGPDACVIGPTICGSPPQTPQLTPEPVRPDKTPAQSNKEHVLPLHVERLIHQYQHLFDTQTLISQIRSSHYDSFPTSSADATTAPLPPCSASKTIIDSQTKQLPQKQQVDPTDQSPVVQQTRPPSQGQKLIAETHRATGSVASGNTGATFMSWFNPRTFRPPAARTSSAVFRGLADEERATGE